MLEKNKLNIETEDLFSLMKVKKKSEKLSRKEKEEILVRKQEIFDLLCEPFKMNDYKTEVVNEANEKTYDKENLQNFYIVLWKHIFMVLDFCRFSINLIAVIITLYIPIYISNLLDRSQFLDGKDVNMKFSILLILSALLVFRNLMELRKEKWNFKKVRDRFQDKVLWCFKKFIKSERTMKTLDYCSSNTDAIVFYENKTDDPMYNKILLEEIRLHNLRNKVWEGVYFNLSIKLVVSKTNKRYMNYLNEQRDLDLLKRLINE